MQMFQRFQNNSHPLITEAVRRDTSEWYHLVWSIDTTQSTSSNRVKMYVNNVQQSFISGSNSQPDQHEALYFNKDERHTIGVGQDSGGLEVYFDGYMAEMNFIDGQQLPPSSFAETNSNGKWVPKDTSDLTFGTNGRLDLILKIIILLQLQLKVKIQVVTVTITHQIISEEQIMML